MCRHSGLITEAELFQQMASRYERYNGTSAALSLIEAGKNKGGNYSQLYFGGMYFALALDIELLTATNGKKRLTDYMNLMFHQFEKKTGKTYTYSDLVSIASHVAEKDMSAFFNQYAEKPGKIPVEEYLTKIGLSVSSVEGKQTFKRLPNVSALQQQYLSAILK
jgi:predicted metalloprotease with PDZ domain